jgi:nucleotide-binding universal stress UspA family protein
MTPLEIPVEKVEGKIEAKKAISLKNIMVATDFSEATDRALDYAVSLARRFGSRIYLTHVITFEGHELMEPDLAAPTVVDLRRLAEEGTKKIESSGRLSGVPYQVVIEEGKLWTGIEALLKKYEIDLLVLGTHGLGGIDKVLIGSSAEELFRQVQVPVLTVGPGAKGEPLRETEFKNILFATDFGKWAEREAAFAFALAQEHRAKLTMLHVFANVKQTTSPDAVRERDRITRLLKELLPTEFEVLCKPDYQVAYGEPGEEILRTAQATKADLIVMGAKKGQTFAGHLPHTKAYHVVCGAKCPVLTIKS